MCHLNQTFLTWDGHTLCVINSICSEDSHWFKLACQHFSLYTSCRWGEIPPGEWGNATRCKEWFWNGAQLNCSHMMSKSESHLKSSIIILAFPDSICWGLSSWICHPWGIWECRQWTYEVCVRVPGSTWAHTEVFHTSTGRHAAWHVSYSQHAHCWHTWYTIYSKVTHKKPSEMTIFMSHTQTAWLTLALGLKSYITPDPWLTETSTPT